MNLFYLDNDLDQLAEYHIDKHVGKIQLEAVQLLSTALWVDKYLGYVPRALTPEEWGIIKEIKSTEPSIDERTFTRYLPCHYNHGSAIWVRESLENFYWTMNYVFALESERLARGYKNDHASSVECRRLPEPKNLKDVGFTTFYEAMPPELKTGNVVDDYRLFYMLDKASFSSWRNRPKPYWWDENIAMYDRRYTELTPAERRATGYLK